MPRQDPNAPSASAAAQDAVQSPGAQAAAARINHRHLEVFRALMLSGSTTAAAQMLFTSQPTISRELARLEQLLGYALFERQQGRLRATARALSLWEQVQRSWQGLDVVVQHALALAQPEQARISVLCLPALGHALLPGALARLYREHGPVAVSVVTQEGPLLAEWLAAQRFDLGLGELALAPPGTQAVALPQVQEVAVVPAGHALAAKPVLELADFEGQPFVSLAPEDPYRQQIDAAFAATGVQRQMVLEADSAMAVCALVQQGLGLAVVNPFTARACAGSRLVLRPLAHAIAFQVHALLPLHRPGKEEVQWLVRALRQEVEAGLRLLHAPTAL